MPRLEVFRRWHKAWNENVRTTGANDGIDELAASIASVGLLQGLVVKKEPRGKYAGVAGRRRFLAWSKLTKALTTEATISGEDSPPTSTAEDRGHFSEYSAALLESPTHHKTAAGAAELAAQPTVALAALVHALKLSNFGLDLHLYRGKSSLQVSMSQALLESAVGSPALAQLDQQGQNWLTMLPPDSAELWRWCLEQDQGTLIQLLAYCMARSLNGGQLKNNNVLRSLITAPFSISENHRCPVGGSSWETKQIVRTR